MIIGAHPDDELLWFNSILRHADEVVIVFKDFWAQPHIGAARAAAIADYPRDRVTCLDIAESGAHGCADWSDPAENEFGLTLGLEANRRELTRFARISLSKVAAYPPGNIATASVARAYSANFKLIGEALRPRLSRQMNVFTHNPWGEYGHEEHVQVFRVLQRLREEIGLKLWMSNYCTNRALPLAMRYFEACPGSHLRLKTDKPFADEVAATYKKHGCWTWADNWAWFDDECFMEAPREGADSASHQHLFPLNFFTIDDTRSRKWVPLALSVSVASAAIGVAISETI